MDDVRRRVSEIELAAAAAVLKKQTGKDDDDGEVDLIIVSHYIEDHCNRESLTQCAPSAPVITIAGTKISSWNHFTSIEIMPEIDLHAPENLWRDVPDSTSLPKFLRVGRLPSNETIPALHFATLIAYAASEANTSGAQDDASHAVETILYSPHGFYADRLQKLNAADQDGKSRMLAVLHGLDPAWYPQPANLGVQNGWQLAVKTRAKYWVPTHDEHLAHGGVNGYLQTKHKKSWADIQRVEGDGGEDVVCREVANGEGLVLV